MPLLQQENWQLNLGYYHGKKVRLLRPHPTSWKNGFLSVAEQVILKSRSFYLVSGNFLEGRKIGDSSERTVLLRIFVFTTAELQIFPGAGQKGRA